MSVRDSLNTPKGQATTILLVVVAVALLGYHMLRGSDASRLSDQLRNRIYICSETGKPFEVRQEEGMVLPVYSPHSGENTGYLAELCWWTASGEVRDEAHPVLLEQTLGRPGPTYCPDCDRLVVPHNPDPNQTPDPMPAPPLQSQGGQSGR